jgi:hypothetical protein
MHFLEVVLCGDVAVYRNQVDATEVGFAVVRTWEVGHIVGRVAVVIDADAQEVGELYQLELKPCCLPAIGGGASKNDGFAAVVEHWVVLRGVVMPFITYLLAADFAKHVWVRCHPAEDYILPRLEEPVVTV